ncbi:MAG: T9SS type A sorting domain-containing protein [Spirosomataceae bacterium]
MKATKFLLLLWAIALGSMAGWSQTVNQPTLTLTNPSGTASSNVAVCPGGGSLSLNYVTSGGTVQLELRSNTSTGPLVPTFGTGGIINPAPSGTVVNTPVTIPALTAGNTYFLIVNVTSGMTSVTNWVTIVPTALPTSPALDFTMTPSLVCVQPGNASIATVVSPNTAAFGYTWSKVEGAPAANTTLSTTTGTTTTATPSSAPGTTDITLTAAYRSMSCGTTSVTKTLTSTAAVAPKIDGTPGAPVGITFVSPAGVFMGAAPHTVADNAICEGTQIQLSSFCPSGIMGQPDQIAVWSRNGVEIGTGSPINLVPVGSPGSANYLEFTYTVKCRVIGSDNCESASSSILIKTIKQESLVPSTPSLTSSSICQAITGGPTTTSFTASTTCPAGSTAQWYDASSGGSPVTTGPTRTHSGVDITVAGPQTWYVTCKQGICESATRTAYTFTVIAKPGQPTITNTNGDYVCSNSPAGPSASSLVLTALCAPGTTANWYLASVTGTTGLTPIAPTADPTVGIVGTGGSYTHSSTGPGTATYQVRCKDNTTGCWSELSASRTITINQTAAAPTGTLVWQGGSGTKICQSLTPGATANPDLTSVTCPTGTTVKKWYTADGTTVIPAPANLSIVGAPNPGPNPTGTLVATYTYQVACEDPNADPGAGNICESSKITVSITVVRAPAAPAMVRNDTGNPIASLDILCQGPNNTTFITSNCPTLPGWQTEWQIVGTLATQGSGAHWATNAPQTNDAGANNDNNILLVNGSNFDPTFTTAANGWTIRARCHDGNIPTGCQDGATTEVTGVKVNVKENSQAFYMQAPPDPNPLNNVIASGKDLCLGSTIKLIQVEPLLPGGICSGVIQWQSRFRATVGSGTFSDWAMLGENSPLETTPAAVGEYEYRIRCNGLCPSDWSASQAIAISKPPVPVATLSPTDVTCQEPSAGTLITLSLSGCVNAATPGNGITASTYVISRTVQDGANAPVTNSSYAAVASTGASQTWTETVNASASNSTNITYTYVVSCRQTFDVIAGGGTSTCTGDPAAAQTITIRTKPAPPTNLAVDATPICQGQSANLTATCAEGQVEWFNITDNTVLGTVASGTPISTGVLNASHSYKARCVVPGCNGNYAITQVSVSVIVAAKPVLSQTNAVLCPTPAIAPSVKMTTLSAAGCSGVGESIVWSSASGGASGATLTVATASGMGAQVVISGTTTFTATCTRPGGCTSTETIEVSVLADPQISITPASVAVCVGSPITLTAASVLGPIAGWSWTGSGSLVTGLNQNDPSISAPVGGATLAMTGTYNFTANYLGCVYSTATAPAKTATVTVNAVPSAPTVGGGGIYCANTSVTLTASGCAGTVTWSPMGPVVTVPASGSATYTATCTVGGCTSPVSSTVTITAKPFEITIIDVDKSGYRDRSSQGSGLPITVWDRIYPAPTGQPSTPASFMPKSYPGASQSQVTGTTLDETTPTNRRVFDQYQTPRFWTVNVVVCNPTLAAATKSISYEMYLLNPVTEAIMQSFNTIENNPPYLQFGNGDQFTRLFTLNDPAFGFYSPTGVYDAGFPKGKYNWRIRAWDKPGVDYGPYPSNVTKNVDPTANILAEANYYIDVTNASGARVGAEVVEAEFATVTPNPVTRTLTLSINGAKGQEVKLNLVDAAGRSLMTRSITPETNSHREEVDMSNNNTGMYFMQVTSPVKSAALKVLKVSQD